MESYVYGIRISGRWVRMFCKIFYKVLITSDLRGGKKEKNNFFFPLFPPPATHPLEKVGNWYNWVGIPEVLYPLLLFRSKILSRVIYWGFWVLPFLVQFFPSKLYFFPIHGNLGHPIPHTSIALVLKGGPGGLLSLYKKNNFVIFLGFPDSDS